MASSFFQLGYHPTNSPTLDVSGNLGIALRGFDSLGRDLGTFGANLAKTDQDNADRILAERMNQYKTEADLMNAIQRGDLYRDISGRVSAKVSQQALQDRFKMLEKDEERRKYENNLQFDQLGDYRSKIFAAAQMGNAALAGKLLQEAAANGANASVVNMLREDANPSRQAMAMQQNAATNAGRLAFDKDKWGQELEQNKQNAEFLKRLFPLPTRQDVMQAASTGALFENIAPDAKTLQDAYSHRDNSLLTAQEKDEQYRVREESKEFAPIISRIAIANQNHDFDGVMNGINDLEAAKASTPLIERIAKTYGFNLEDKKAVEGLRLTNELNRHPDLMQKAMVAHQTGNTELLTQTLQEATNRGLSGKAIEYLGGKSPDTARKTNMQQQRLERDLKDKDLRDNQYALDVELQQEIEDLKNKNNGIALPEHTQQAYQKILTKYQEALKNGTIGKEAYENVVNRIKSLNNGKLPVGIEGFVTTDIPNLYNKNKTVLEASVGNFFDQNNKAIPIEQVAKDASTTKKLALSNIAGKIGVNPAMLLRDIDEFQKNGFEKLIDKHVGPLNDKNVNRRNYLRNSINAYAVKNGIQPHEAAAILNQVGYFHSFENSLLPEIFDEKGESTLTPSPIFHDNPMESAANNALALLKTDPSKGLASFAKSYYVAEDTYTNLENSFNKATNELEKARSDLQAARTRFEGSKSPKDAAEIERLQQKVKDKNNQVQLVYKDLIDKRIDLFKIRDSYNGYLENTLKKAAQRERQASKGLDKLFFRNTPDK